MDSADEKVVAVILVAGPSTGANFLILLIIKQLCFEFKNSFPFLFGRFCSGTRFRPLSFNTPEPLFPLAGQPMVHHHISACKRVYFCYFGRKRLSLINVIFHLIGLGMWGFFNWIEGGIMQKLYCFVLHLAFYIAMHYAEDSSCALADGWKCADTQSGPSFSHRVLRRAGIRIV